MSGDAAAVVCPTPHAPIALFAQLSTRASDFDTLLAVYKQGDSLASLVHVVGNDDCPAGSSLLTSCVTFDALPGATYRVQVAGYGPSYGTAALSMVSVPNTCRAATAPCTSGPLCCSRRCVRRTDGLPGRQCQ